MAKYVCDFEQVIAAGEKLISIAGDLEASVSSYSNQVYQDLSSWSGAAKESFKGKCDYQVEEAIANAKAVKSAGEFIKSSAEAIQANEEKLANLSI